MNRMAIARLAVILVGIVFAVQGGEYSVWNWLELRRAEGREATAVSELKNVVDSLEKTAVAIERNPRVQERVARESFGMIANGEFLLRVVPPAEP